MKRIVCVLLVFVMIFSSCLLTSCSLINKMLGKDNTDGDTSTDTGGTGDGESPGTDNDSDVIPVPPIPEDEQLNITESGYTFFCKSDDAAVRESFSNLIYRVAKTTGKTPVIASSEAEANVIFAVEDYTSHGAGSVIGRYEISMRDGKLYVCAGNTESLNIAKDRLLAYSTDKGIVISNKMNESNMFNIFDYRVGKVTVYTPTDLANLNLISQVKIDGAVMNGFNPMKNFYSLKVEGEYPTLSASAINSAAAVNVEQASEENGGTAKITVTANKSKRVYSFDFYTESSEAVFSSIVTKNGAKGTICFVIDDGTESTATFMYENILGKEGYENITASFALKTVQLATFNTTTDEKGNTVYLIDENGNYSYTEINGKFDFWRNILATDKAYLLSHTHTHTDEGENDTGGVFGYKKNNGTYTNTPDFAVGNVTMELVGSNQIIKAVSGEDDSIALILPGVGAAHSGYFNNLYLNCGEYLVARGTAGADNLITDYNTVVYQPEELDENTLKSVKSYMIEHYLTDPTGSTTKASSNAECLEAGIKNWTDFMDTAIYGGGGWASFCIHEIRPDNYTGSDHHIYESQAKQLFAYANKYGDDAWIASYNDAAKYYIEWNNSTVSSKIYDNSSIAVALETDLADPRFDMALTVRVEIPESWAGAKLGAVSLEIREDENGRFVYVDVLPGESLKITADGYTSVADDGVALG